MLKESAEGFYHYFAVSLYKDNIFKNSNTYISLHKYELCLKVFVWCIVVFKETMQVDRLTDGKITGLVESIRGVLV